MIAVIFLIWNCGVSMSQPTSMPFEMPGKSYSGALPALSESDQALAARLKTHVEVLATTVGERNIENFDALERAAGYIEAQMTELGYEVGRQEYAVGHVNVRNIDATFRGQKLPDEIVLIGAHYDSVRGCPGANDNATGVAAVLEIARAMKEQKLGRTVRFVFFVNEEPPYFRTPHMGSWVYAKRCKKRGEKIVAMLTPETIGYYSDQKGSQKYPAPFDRFYPDMGNFIGFVGDVSARELVRRCVGSFRQHTKFPSEGGAFPDVIEGVGWSDHWSFTRLGYPALMITDTAPFRYEHYHTPEDTPDKIDFGKMARVVTGINRVVGELARDAVAR